MSNRTFVPIYQEYDQVDVVSSVPAAKQAAGKKSTPGKPKTAPQYTYAGFDYIGIKLNLRLATRDLQQAKTLIEQHDATGATALLQDILHDGVIFEFSALDEPLVRATDNFRLVETELKAKHLDEAKVGPWPAQPTR